MKKRIIQVLTIALALLAVVLIHRRVRYETEEAAKLASAVTAEQSEETALPADAAHAAPVLRLGEGVTLGTMAENAELGGVNITVTSEDGTETVYTFTDVAAGAWYADAVNFAVSAGLMSGVGDKQVFHPNYGVLRETFASILYRYAKGEPAAKKLTLDDVAEDAWYHDAVTWAVNSGLLMPASGQTFGVGEYMTCEQALIVLYRLAGEPETDGSLAEYPYAAKVSEYGRSAVDWAWKNGLITEDDITENECVWYPTQAISRAQVALLLTRFSEKNL